MIACCAWTNLQILNVTNARINNYSDQEADLYVRMSAQISEALIKAVKASGAYKNVYCFDPVMLNYKKLLFGFIPNFRVFFLRFAYQKAYNQLLRNTCPDRTYERVLLPLFHTDNIFMIHRWAKSFPKLRITFTEDGTGTYCCSIKELCNHTMEGFKGRIKRIISERALTNKYRKRVDTVCVYRPEYCMEKNNRVKLTLLPVIGKENPIMHELLIKAMAEMDYSHFIRYEKRSVYYFSTYNVLDKSFDQRSMEILEAVISGAGPKNVIAKIHTNSSLHAKNFAKAVEQKIFVDREKYIFEGLYMQIPGREEKILVSVASSTAICPKFMFDEEPYVILTYRLYGMYRQCGVERDDRLAEVLQNAYTDKSRVMVPNSLYELKDMLAKALGRSSWSSVDVDEFLVSLNESGGLGAHESGGEAAVRGGTEKTFSGEGAGNND